MPVAIVRSRALSMGYAPEVNVEVYLANGLPSFTIVGLPDTEVRESRERVRAAIQNCGFDFPAKRLTVNLTPADLPKESGRFDLPMALGILVASQQLSEQVIKEAEFAGELSLSGEVRAIRGALAMASEIALQNNKQPHPTQLYVPISCAKEAALAPGVSVIGVTDLLSLCNHLKEKQDHGVGTIKPTVNVCIQNNSITYPDFNRIIGQKTVKRGLEIAAAGGHHVLMIGPPGAGKSMLSTCFPNILPAMSDAEALSSAAILNAYGSDFTLDHWRRRPFRAPHHSASSAALIGGGNPPRPGEITLAHHGVLFLDELPEFERRTIEMLRQPLETGKIQISRAGYQSNFPANFQLIAAMNPCPCGWKGHPNGRCRCTNESAQRYRNRVSGPLFDRIDIHIEVNAVPAELLFNTENSETESSASIAQRVSVARQYQQARQKKINTQLDNSDIKKYASLPKKSAEFLYQVSEKFGWSARTHTHVLKLARTIADLNQIDNILHPHLVEAIQYRRWQ